MTEAFERFPSVVLALAKDFEDYPTLIRWCELTAQPALLEKYKREVSSDRRKGPSLVSSPSFLVFRKRGRV